MPQIWMTYDEIAAMLECTPTDARLRAIDQMLDRRKSRDGQTRVKLNLPLTSLFIEMTGEAYLRHRAKDIVSDAGSDIGSGVLNRTDSLSRQFA